MSLSGKSDWKNKREAARDARHEREDQWAAKRPWQLPLIIGVAVTLLVAAILWNLLH